MLCLRFATTPQTVATYQRSSIAHVTPNNNLPACFTASSSKFFAMLQVGSRCLLGFGFIHGGYAFGGQRAELKQYTFGPVDCSSIVQNWLDSLIYARPYASTVLSQFSTVDELYAWRATKQWQHYFKDKIETSVSQKKVQAGDIYFSRNFPTKNGPANKQAGSAGHTGVVIGKDPQDSNKVLIFHCSRDMEAENRVAKVYGCAGTGVGSFSSLPVDLSNPNTEKHAMFLRPKARA